jgi:catechol 2,3-dioxygenase-like lactoylglutathione lyase family enzyme
MKRLHVMLKVNDLNESIKFYSALFGTEPTTQKDDYAKWLIEDPKVNFSIAERPGEKGIEHLGIQAESETELEEVRHNIGRASKGVTRDEGDTICCYAKSNKSWISDPQGVEWEAFYTYGESKSYTEQEVTCC